jgi:hypothetical protein
MNASIVGSASLYKSGTVKFMKVMDNNLNLLEAEEVLKAAKAAAS